jgi:uncharacterized protein (DUF427 family)
MPRAVWNNTVIAETSDTVIVEGNHYFPRESLNPEYFHESPHTSHCGWKGEARYFNVSVNGQTNANAAWYYPTPKPAAKEITGRVAFWKGVRVEA